MSSQETQAVQKGEPIGLPKEHVSYSINDSVDSNSRSTPSHQTFRTGRSMAQGEASKENTEESLEEKQEQTVIFKNYSNSKETYWGTVQIL